MHRCHPALIVTALALAVPTSASAAGKLDRDYAAYARNIIPSGQLGSVPIPDGADTQAKMYDALTPLFDKVQPKDLLADFKSEKFGVGSDGPGKKETGIPMKGVTIVRDRFSVPHVTATTYDKGIWAAGWIAAEDRGLLLQQARNNSRVAVIDAPGLSALGLIAGLRTFVPSAQTEAATAAETNALLKAGKKGRQVYKDIKTFCKGINAFLKKSGSSNPPWTPSDVYALEALKGQFVGQGGGDEARETQFFSALQARLGPTGAMSLFNDIRQHDDPDMPHSIDGVFPYEKLPATPSGNVLIDPGSFQPISSLSGGGTVRSAKVMASNELMVDGKHSATGRPLLVGGPQIGYYYPGLTYEIDMHAPGLVWRGATSAPFPGYMLIGRGPDFATTLTSADGDIIDQYAETLCGGSDTKYMYKGTCRDMDVFNAGTLKGKSAGDPDQTVAFHSTVHGPVVGYATVGGKKVAISSKRSSRGKDVLDLLYNHDISTGVVHSPATFFKAAAQSPQTFNSFYIDNRHIAEFTSGLLPVRPASVDPGLLTDGSGSYEWKGYISAGAHPHGTNPKNGRIVNWNNNAARGFGASDDQWHRAGAEGRVDLLNKGLDRLAVHGKLTLASVASAMNAAATQDIRAVNTVPLLVRVLAGSTGTARAQQLLSLMQTWSQGTSSRLDEDLDGKIDNPGAAVTDVAWPFIGDAVMGPALGPNLAEFAALSPRSSLDQYNGWYQYIDKDLKTLLGDKVTQPFNTRFCGNGDKAACQAALWKALDDAAAAGATQYGTADASQWHADANAERIKFTPGLLQTTIRWTNRPTGIQQVISFNRHR